MKKKKLIAIVVIGLIVLIFGILVWWFLSQQAKDLSGNYKESQSQNYIEYGDKKYQYNEHLSNYLFLGIDTREAVETYEGQSDAGQSDAIMLVSYDRVKKTITCLTIPRDTMANVQIITPDGTDVGKGKQQITLQYAYGDGKHKSCELTKAAVSEMLYGVPIQGYCSVNMDGIPIAVGQVGSVDVVVPNGTLENVNPIYKEGATVTITQENAEEFVRHRDTNQDFSAMDRLERQRAFAPIGILFFGSLMMFPVGPIIVFVYLWIPQIPFVNPKISLGLGIVIVILLIAFISRKHAAHQTNDDTQKE